MDAKNKIKTSLVAIAKNEGSYIREWVVYHKKVCGFSEIFVYENDSTDNTRSELESMAAEGLCKWKPWPRSEHNPPQQTAYRDALASKDRHDWVCFLDIDEFLVINSHETAGEFASKFENDVGSISFNWVIFYSLEKNKTEHPTVKRVSHCYGDGHVKTMARTIAVTGANIHTVSLAPGYKYMHCSGLEYKVKEDKPIDVQMCLDESTRIFDCRAGHVNHYLMKSEQEVVEKDERGRATTRLYAKKNIKEMYDNIAKIKSHRDNDNIRRFIEKMHGLGRFYEAARARK
jgi:glycosyltransferase involved in cell wall biosynthesis